MYPLSYIRMVQTTYIPNSTICRESMEPHLYFPYNAVTGGEFYASRNQD